MYVIAVRDGRAPDAAQRRRKLRLDEGQARPEAVEEQLAGGEDAALRAFVIAKPSWII